MSKPTQKVTALNKRQGGSYTKDPKTGKTTLVEQTKHQEITGFEENKPVGSTSVVQKKETKS